MSKEHNHIKLLRRMHRQGKLQAKPGTVTNVEVSHDEWCNLLRGMKCNCRPHITITRVQEASDGNSADDQPVGH